MTAFRTTLHQRQIMSLDLRTRLGGWIYKAAVAGVLICVIYYVLIVIYITLCRIRYPFSLEFAEGDALIQVLRILQGKALYAQPSFRYVALDYPPVYFYVSAWASRLIGFGFFPLRLVSFISSLGCIALIYLICRKEGTGILPALIAADFLPVRMSWAAPGSISPESICLQSSFFYWRCIYSVSKPGRPTSLRGSFLLSRV